jgi:CubicO group peptidase (beta-lactamase class C family)
VTAVTDLHGAAGVTVAGTVTLAVAGGPHTPDTRFRIASVSKQMAAVAVLLLAGRGAVDLDEPIGRWFPGAPAPWRRITPHQLLTHTAGIGHWDPAVPGFDVFASLDPGARLELIQRAPLRTEPGAEWHYSSPGYLVVGRIVELASGQPYHAFLNERLFAPLGLADTGAGAGAPTTSPDLSMFPGTGDVWSTVPDLNRFVTAVHCGRLVPAGALTARQVPLDRDTAYGYGVRVGTVAGHRAVFHFGDIPGYSSLSAWLPEHEASAAVLSDDETTDVEAVLREVLPAALARPG